MPNHPPSNAAADRNLLFGILALQMDFITRDELIAGMNAWTLEKDKGLGSILMRQAALPQDCYAALTVMVDKHLEVHQHDPQRSLQALSSLASVRQDLKQVADADVQASLAHLPATDDAPLRPEPTTLGLPTATGTRFRVLRPHAKGGLGQVFVARDEELHREVALKEIQEHSADNPMARERFLREAEITGALEHPGIVPVYGLGQYPDGRPFYAMRFIRGDSLKFAIERFHKNPNVEKADGRRENASANAFLRSSATSAVDYSGLDFRQLLGRFVDVCNAVAYAHSRGVLHRDLKPGNIMLGKYGETLVVDRGLAKTSAATEPASTDEAAVAPTSGRDDSSKTQAGTALGSPPFMSPEQAAGRLDLMGPASDIYSLGATLYVLLTGRLPFPEKDTGEILQRVQRGDFVPPRRLMPDVPAALDAICRKAMALRPADRYASALELAADVEHWLADEPVSSFREPWTVRSGRWMRRHKPLVSAAAATILVSVIAASAGTVWYQHEQARQTAEDALRQVEKTRKIGVAEQSIRDALEQASKARADLHKEIKNPRGVFALLNEPARWQAHVAAAQAAVERAKAVLASAADVSAEIVSAGRISEVEALVRADDEDRRFAEKLERIRLDRSTISNEGFDNAGAARAYPAAFVAARFAVDDDHQASNIGSRIAASPIKDQLVAALDDWAAVAMRFKQYGRADHIFAIARHADPDPDFRDHLRRSDTLSDAIALAALAKKAPADRLSPQTILLIANFLPKNDTERERLLKTGLIRFPADFWLHLQLATDTQATNLTEAIGYARTAVAVRPHSAAAHSNLGNMLSKQRRLVEAVAAFDNALAIEPQSASICNNLAGALRDNMKLKEALDAVDKALKLDPGLAKAHNNRGSILGDMGRAKESLAAHEKAVELNPGDVEAQNNLGVAYRQLGRNDEAIAAYEKTIALDPNHATAYSNLALALFDKKQYSASAAAAQKAIDLNPKNAFAYNHLGMALDELNRAVEAIVAFRKAAELKEDFAAAHYNLGLTLHKLKRWGEAVAAHQKSVALEPNLPHRQGALGQSLLQQGSFQEALDVTRKALKLPPASRGMVRQLQDQLQQCQRLLAMEDRLARVADKNEPASTKELLELAQFCQRYSARHVTALSLYRRAFAHDATVVENMTTHPRYNAACAALSAGLGAGPQAAKLTDAEKSDLRRDARSWLEAELVASAKAVQAGSCADVLRAQDHLAHWQSDEDLAGVRDAKRLAQLPKDEQLAWSKLWTDSQTTHKASMARFRETRLEGALTPQTTSRGHEFTMLAKKVYVVDLESTAFDTLLKIEDPQGQLVADNDDYNSHNLDSRLIYQPKTDGIHRIVATSFREQGTGTYSLRIREFLGGK